jgi:branched-chain amino acid transport system ATP-binding protein
MLQEFSTFPDLTVQENLLLGAWIFRRDQALIKKRLKDIYGIFPELDNRRNQRANVLSGGLLRMLSVGKEIMTKPKLLLIDEPSAGLAPLVVKEIYDLLLRISDQGTTILLVDQNIMKAIEVSNYMYLVELGKIKHHGPKDVFKDNIRELIKESLFAD